MDQHQQERIDLFQKSLLTKSATNQHNNGDGYTINQPYILVPGDKKNVLVDKQSFLVDNVNSIRGSELQQDFFVEQF